MDILEFSYKFPPISNIIRITSILFMVLIFIILDWFFPYSLLAGTRILWWAYIAVAPLSVMLLAKGFNLPVKNRVICFFMRHRYVAILTIMAAVLLFLAYYETYACADWLMSDTTDYHIKSILFKRIYKQYDELGGAFSLASTIRKPYSLSMFISAFCWILCACFNKHNRIVAAVTFINAGLIVGAFHSLHYLALLTFEEVRTLEIIMNDLLFGLRYVLCGIVSAILWHVMASRVFSKTPQ